MSKSITARNQDLQQLEILYELSMSIGDSLDMRRMLKSSISTFLKKINCVAGGVYRIIDREDEARSFEEIYVIPRRTKRNIAYQEAITLITEMLADSRPPDYAAKMPLVGRAESGNYYHVFELPDFGFLLLVKNREPIDPLLVKSLRPLLQRLAMAANACLLEEDKQQALDDASSLLKATLDSTADGILVVDGQGKIVRANQQFAQMWRMPAEILAAKDEEPGLAFILDQLSDPDQFIRKVEELYANPEAESFDVLTFKDGRIFERISKPQRIHDQVVGRVWSFRDVTSRKQAQKQRRQLAMAVEQSLDGTAVADMEGVIQFVNPAWAEMHGYEIDELIGQDLSVLHTEEQLINEVSVFNQYVRKSGSHQDEVGHKRKDGTVFRTWMSVVLLKDEAGVPIGFVAFAQDITERKEAEKEMQQLATAVEQSLDGIAVTDMAGTIQFINRAGAEMHGYDVEELIGQSLLLFHTEEQLQNTIMPLIKQLRETALPHQGEVGRKRKDGTTFPSWTTVSLIKNADGAHIGMVASVRDITEQQQIEAAIQEHANKLEAVTTISIAISSVLESDLLLQSVSDHTKEQFNLYHAHIYLMSDDKTTLELKAGAGEAGRKLVAKQHHILLDHPYSLVVKAARTRKGVIVNDVKLLPDYMSNPYLPNTQSEMAIPILMGDRVLGVLDLQSDKIGDFSNEDLNIHTTLASQIAVALENAHQYNETQEALLETEALLSITGTANGTLALEAMLKEVLSEVLRVTTFESGLFSVINPESDLLELYAYHLPEKWVDRFHEEGLEKTLCGLVYHREEPILLTDMSVNAPIDVSSMVADGYYSYQGVPLIAQGQVLGTLCLFGIQRLTIQDSDIEWLSAVGQQIGFAIQNARLYEQSEKTLQEKELLTRRLTREGWDAYTDTQDEALSFMYDAGGVQRVDEIETAVTTTTPYDHPLLVYGEQIGNLALFAPDDEEEWDNEQVEIITAVADQLTARIENLRLTDETQRALSATKDQAKRLRTINQVAQAVSQESDIERILNVIYRQIEQILPINSLFLGSYNTESDTLIVPMYIEDGELYHEERKKILTPDTGSYHVIRTGEYYIKHITPEEFITQDPSSENFIGDLEQHPSVSQLFVPLQAGTKQLGILSIQSDQYNVYKDSDAELIQGIANYVAIALENIRLFSETEERAEQLAIINRVAQGISKQLDLKDAVEVVYNELRAALPVDAFFISFYDAEYNTIEYPFVFEGEHRSTSPAAPLRNSSNSRIVIDSGSPVVRHLIREEALLLEQEDERAGESIGDTSKEFTKSQLFVPLQSGQKMMGVLSVQTYAFDAYTESDVELMMGVAQYLAVAIENIRLFADTQMRAAQLEKLSTVEGALSRARSEVDIVEALALLINDEQSITLYYVEESADEIPVYAYTVAYWKDGKPQLEEEMLMKPFLIEQHGETHIGLDNPSQVTFIVDSAEDERMGDEDGAVIIVSMQSAGRWQGFISLRWAEAHQFTEDELFLWTRLREPLAAVVAGRRAFMAQQGTLRETETLYEAGEKLNSADSYDDVLDVLRAYTLLGSGAHNVSLNYFSEAWAGDTIPETVYVMARKTAVEYKSRFTTPSYPLRAFPSAHNVLNPDEPVLIEDLTTDPRIDDKVRQLYVHLFKAVSTIFVPLVAGGQWFGYINAVYDKTKQFPDDEVRRLMALAGQAAVSIHSIHLLEETAKRAEREQTLRQITERVRSSTTVEVVLQTAVQELSRALGRRAFIQLNPEQKIGGGGK